MVLAAVDILLDSASARENRLDRLYQQIDEQTLREAVMSCRYFKRLEERGYLDELCARYAPPRRYLPTFFGTALPGGDRKRVVTCCDRSRTPP